jgi:ubiquitin C-terminal hydrolase
VGDNQYLCENCGCKCDAERQMQLRSLPPYLCLSLQRFVFDMQVGRLAEGGGAVLHVS